MGRRMPSCRRWLPAKSQCRKIEGLIMENEDLEFMSELETANHLKPSKASQIFLWTITGLFFWLIIWAATSEVDERVRGTGQVMTSSDVQVMQSLEGGILSELLVTEGDVVKKD